MKKLLFSIIAVSSAILASDILTSGQNLSSGRSPEVQIRKLLVADDIENQLKDIPYAAVRVFVRYKLVTCLWKDGIDDSGRGEQVAIRAFDDLYENKGDVPSVYFNSLSSELLVLIERNAPDIAKKLRNKYNLGADAGLASSESLFGQRNGDKLAVDAFIESIANQEQISAEIIPLATRLSAAHSPELPRLLIAVLWADELGRADLGVNLLFLLAGRFVDENVPKEVKIRFLRLVIVKARNASVLLNSEFDEYFLLLTSLMGNISVTLPDLLPEANVIRAVLKTKSSLETREAEDRNERISNAEDKLGATISEAEKADNKAAKYDLYVRAAQLALTTKKFERTLYLIEKAMEIDFGSKSIPENSRKRWSEQLRSEVVAASLRSSDPVNANRAIRKIDDPLLRAECLKNISIYYLDNGDRFAAESAFSVAIKSISTTEVSALTISRLLGFIPTAQKISPALSNEVTGMAAKQINSMPEPDIGTQRNAQIYSDYVTRIMIINWNLFNGMKRLVGVSRTEANDFANRIENKEVKVVADLVLLTEALP